MIYLIFLLSNLDAFFKDIPFIFDIHMHIVGSTNKKKRNFIHEDSFEWFNLIDYFTTQIMIKAFGIRIFDDAFDEKVQNFIMDRVKEFPIQYYGCLMALCSTFDRTGKEDLNKTSIKVSNEYVMKFTENKDNLITIGSVHPFDNNVKKKINYLYKRGIRFIKIIPNSMFFSPNDQKCFDFFKTISQKKMVIIAHVGHEKAITAAGVEDEYGNPMLYEKWLEMFPNLKIVFAHVGIGGKVIHENNIQETFDLALKIEKLFPNQVYFDISTLICIPNKTKYIKILLQKEYLYKKLIYGSDYPLPYMSFTSKLALYFISKEELFGENSKEIKKQLLKIYEKNPLIYNYLALRAIKYKNKSFPKEIFYKNVFDLFDYDNMPKKLKKLKKLKKF